MRQVTPSRRASPRAQVQLALTLARGKGNPIDGRTLDLGVGGMRVGTERPLAVDEVVTFDMLMDASYRLAGSARVIGEHAPNVYGLRFERLSGDGAERLLQLVAAADAPTML